MGLGSSLSPFCKVKGNFNDTTHKVMLDNCVLCGTVSHIWCDTQVSTNTTFGFDLALSYFTAMSFGFIDQQIIQRKAIGYVLCIPAHIQGHRLKRHWFRNIQQLELKPDWFRIPERADHLLRLWCPSGFWRVVKINANFFFTCSF